MPHHDIKLYNQLIVNSAQGFHNTIEYLLFQIQYFQKKKFKGLFEKKSTLSENFGGGDLFPPTCSGGSVLPCLVRNFQINAGNKLTAKRLLTFFHYTRPLLEYDG